MDTLPYELLQLIAGNLLPKHQCRLSLASRYNYRYLYNDLLKWHAKWRQISPPRYRVINDTVSLCEYNDKLLYNTIEVMSPSYNANNYILIIFNLASCNYNLVDDASDIIKVTAEQDPYYSMYIPLFYSVKLFDGFYKNMDRRSFVHFASIRLSPLLSLPSDVLGKILCVLPVSDRNTLRRKVHKFFNLI